MRKDRQRIGIIPIGNIPEIAPKVIAAHISGYLDLQTIRLESMKNLSYALDRQRLQYNVGLFVPVFTHVYGEARQGGRVALISTFRLRENSLDILNDSSIALERAAKVALHELCHLYDLTHCENRRCLMHFSGSLSDLDQGSFNLCRYCRRFFEDAVS
jgi:archaemetzincin